MKNVHEIESQKVREHTVIHGGGFSHPIRKEDTLTVEEIQDVGDARHVMHFNSYTYVTQKDIWYYMRKVLLWALAIVAILSAALKENMFSGVSIWYILVALNIIIVSWWHGGQKLVACPTEIRFYDDYLVIYRERADYGKRQRMEYICAGYGDFTRKVYRTSSHRISVSTIWQHCVYYEYTDRGMKLTHALTVDKAGFTLDLKPEDENQVLREIEEYTGWKFELENS